VHDAVEKSRKSDGWIMSTENEKVNRMMLNRKLNGSVDKMSRANRDGGYGSREGE